MKHFLGFMLAASFAGLFVWLWLRYRSWAQRQSASEERFASFLSQAKPQPASAPPTAAAPPAAIDPTLAQQRLLLEAAAKAGEAGEAVISIQLCARLIARYPAGAMVAQARAAAEAQKKKLVKT
jgi:hypothetical protein